MSTAAYQRDYRKDRYLNDYRRTDATGTRRRLQALAVLGWSMKQISEATGINRFTLRTVARGDIGDRVNRRTAQAVARFYQDHYLTRLDTPYARRQTFAAIRKGWLPSLMWDDIDDICEVPSG